MSDDNNQLEGHCLCGAVTISLSEPRETLGVCHCVMCRRWSGGPFIGISAGEHTVSGADNVTEYQSSDWAKRAFCKVCGSNLYYRFLPGDHYSFLAGLFDEVGGAEMGEQLFIDQRPSYYSFEQETETLTAAEVKAKYN